MQNTVLLLTARHHSHWRALALTPFLLVKKMYILCSVFNAHMPHFKKKKKGGVGEIGIKQAFEVYW